MGLAGTRLPVVASNLASVPLPSPQAGLGLIPLLPGEAQASLLGRCGCHTPARATQRLSSDCFPLPHLGYNHYQPICEKYLPQGRGQGRAWLADRRMAHFILPVMPGYLSAMSGPLALTSALNSPIKKAIAVNKGRQKGDAWNK